MKASNHGDSLGSMTLTSSLVFSGQISLFNIGQETSKKIQIKTNPHLLNEILPLLLRVCWAVWLRVLFK